MQPMLLCGATANPAHLSSLVYDIGGDILVSRLNLVACVYPVLTNVILAGTPRDIIVCDPSCVGHPRANNRGETKEGS